jgi:glycogen synthase
LGDFSDRRVFYRARFGRKIFGRFSPEIKKRRAAASRRLRRLQRIAGASDRSGADMFLMPSRFEPCGLNQMYSLRYGTVPIVRAVGGLDDTVENFDRVNGTGSGFKFNEFRADKFLEKIYEAVFAYHEPDVWRRIQRNGMTVDNSWENAARKYVQLYQMIKA